MCSIISRPPAMPEEVLRTPVFQISGFALSAVGACLPGWCALGSSRLVVCASPAYLKAHGAPLRPEDLMRHDCIAWSTLGPRDMWWFRGDSGTDKQYPIRTRLATTLAESAVDAAVTGIGLVQTTSYQASAAVGAGRLVVVLRKFEIATTPVSLVYVRDRLIPLKLRAFIDFIAPRLSERLRTIAATLKAGTSSA